MVLGIDEYLDESRKNKKTEFIQFKKYYQRIHKRTDCEYVYWFDKNKSVEKSKKYDNEVYIFGHSLDITDNIMGICAADSDCGKMRKQNI